MSRITHRKLVRDRIPEIIEASGKTCVTRTLDDAAYLAALDQKLTEELAEYQQDKSAGELADLLEVMMAVVEARGYDFGMIEQLRREKAQARGRFRDRIWLEAVDTPD